MNKKHFGVVAGNKSDKNKNIHYSKPEEKHKVIELLEDLNSKIDGEYTGYMLIGYKDEPENASPTAEDKTSFGYGWRYCDFLIDRRSMILGIAHNNTLIEDE